MLAEVRRLRSDRGHLAAMLTQLLAADVLADVAADATRIREHRETYAAGYADGHRAGREDHAREQHADWARMARRITRGPAYAEIEARRWELRGEPRTRATFGQPHPADYPGSEGQS